jgi:hypothetical protein
MDFVIALVTTLITFAAVYAVAIWIDKPMPPDRPPSAPAALRIWNVPRRRGAEVCRIVRQRSEMKTARRYIRGGPSKRPQDLTAAVAALPLRQLRAIQFGDNPDHDETGAASNWLAPNGLAARR